MKKILIVALLVLMTTPAMAAPPMTGSPVIVAPDGTYLGNLNNNRYDPNSVSNPYGPYGSPYAPNSINNPYGVYGSPYSPSSPNNPYSTGPVPLFGAQGGYFK